MVISVTAKKITDVDSSVMYSLKEDNVLDCLNKVIDWDKSSFPQKKSKGGVYLEDRKYLGEKPELKVGNVFMVGANILGVLSENELVCIFNESGPLYIKRLWDTYIKPKAEIISNAEELATLVSFKESDREDILFSILNEEFDEDESDDYIKEYSYEGNYLETVKNMFPLDIQQHWNSKLWQIKTDVMDLYFYKGRVYTKPKEIDVDLSPKEILLSICSKIYKKGSL